MPLNSQQQVLAKQIAQGLYNGTHIITTDYDGTVSPYVSNPKEAKMVPSAKNALKQLYALAPNSVMIITGRPVDELQMLLTISLEASEEDNGFTTINAIGSQGFARRINNVITENLFSQAESQFLARVKEDAKALCQKWIETLKGHGLTLELTNLYEEKGQSFGLHWRAITEKLTHDAKENIIEQISTEYEAFLQKYCDHYDNVIMNNNSSASTMPGYRVNNAPRMFEILEGNMVFEFKLRRVSKGGALTEVLALEGFQNKKVVFFGDDYNDGKGTDASAAKVVKDLNNGGVVIQVIDGQKAQTPYALADIQIHTQQGTGEFLQAVADHYQRLQLQNSNNNGNKNQVDFKKK